MPITQSARKALAQSMRRRARNATRRAALRTAVRSYKKLIHEGKKAEAAGYLPQVYKRLDKSAKTRVIQESRAARLKSRLARMLK